MNEAYDALEEQKIHVDLMRLRAFPFPESVLAFINAHDTVFVVEQNRDAQMRSMLVNELGVNPAKLVPVLNYDGTPVTARFITREIAERVTELQAGLNVVPIRKGKEAV